MKGRWKLLTSVAVLGIVACLTFLAIRPISAAPDDLALEASEMPSGWRAAEPLDDLLYVVEGGTCFSRTYLNDSAEVGERLQIRICVYDTTASGATTQFWSVQPHVHNTSDCMFGLGDKSKVFYGTSELQDSNGTHFQDTTTTYLIVIGNVLVEMNFITAGPFTEEQEIRTAWMDDLVVAQYEKVREVGLLF